MSRAVITDEIVDGLSFARACVADQRVASHRRKDHSFDKRYTAAFAALDAIVNTHQRKTVKAAKAAKKRRA